MNATVLHVFSVVALALMLGGCASPGYDTWYRVAVEGAVTTHVSLTDAMGLPSSQSSPPTASKESRQFADKNLAVVWNLWDWSIKLVIKNKTDEPLNILWSEACVAWDAREDHLQIIQPRRPGDTLVRPGKSITYHTFPRSLLRWTSWGDPADGRGHWTPSRDTSPIFGKRYPSQLTKAERQRLAWEAADHEVMILLPLEIGRERINYLFRLKITDANVYRPREFM